MGTGMGMRGGMGMGMGIRGVGMGMGMGKSWGMGMGMMGGHGGRSHYSTATVRNSLGLWSENSTKTSVTRAHMLRQGSACARGGGGYRMHTSTPHPPCASTLKVSKTTVTRAPVLRQARACARRAVPKKTCVTVADRPRFGEGSEGSGEGLRIGKKTRSIGDQAHAHPHERNHPHE